MEIETLQIPEPPQPSKAKIRKYDTTRWRREVMQKYPKTIALWQLCKDREDGKKKHENAWRLEKRLLKRFERLGLSQRAMENVELVWEYNAWVEAVGDRL